MKFGEVFSKSWNELKLNFKLNSKMILYFVFIPGILSLIFSLIYAYSQNLIWMVLSVILLILNVFLTILVSASIIVSSLFNKKDFSSSLSLGKKFYWRYVGLVLVQVIFIVLLALALIVPAIIFGVYWLLTAYVMIGENKGIMDSFRGSFRLVRHKWWKVFGYSILFGIILIAIELIISIPSWPTNIMVLIDVFKNPALYLDNAPPTNISIINQNISGFFSLLSRFIIIPLGIIFYKNIYLALKKK